MSSTIRKSNLYSWLKWQLNAQPGKGYWNGRSVAAGFCRPRRDKPNRHARNAQPVGYYEQVIPVKHMGRFARWAHQMRELLKAREAKP